MRQDDTVLADQRSTDTYEQTFAVRFTYPVVFTNGLFSPDNTVLIDTLCRIEPAKRHKCIVFVDDGLLADDPGLVDTITD